MKGTIAISWGAYGGFYFFRKFSTRICLGWVAITYIPLEFEYDEAMSYTAIQKHQLHFKALKDLEAGIPIDPTLIISGAVSLVKIIAELFAKRSMLKARVTAIEALNATIVAVNALQDERIADLEARLTILEAK